MTEIKKENKSVGKVPNLRFPEFEGEWKVTKLGGVATNVMYGMNAAATDYDGENQYIRITDIDEQTRLFCPNPISSPDGELDNRYLLHKGDILFARTGASVGKSYLYNDKCKLYVDKNLKYHGLIQAFSRTNRILDKNKTQGNIVCFRNLKDKTDEAIALFSNKEAIDEIIVEPYEAYVEKFNEATQKLLEIVPEVVSVDGLYSEEDQLQFILAFRTMMRLHKKMSHYTEFTWDDLQMEEQLFADYTSKYLDLKERLDPTDPSKKASILNDIDFELELIRRDTINVTYILQLLIKFNSKHSAKDKESIEKDIFNLLNTEVSLRSKRELIEKFIQENLPFIEDTDTIPEEFEKFWTVEQEKALQELVKTENLSEEKTERLIENYLFTEREPLRKEILDLRKEGRPSVLKSKEIGDRILNKIVSSPKNSTF